MLFRALSQACQALSGPPLTDALDLDVRRAEMYPERRLSMNNIISSLPTKPVSRPNLVITFSLCLSCRGIGGSWSCSFRSVNPSSPER